MILIPELKDLSGAEWTRKSSPAWIQPVDSEGRKLKPIIRCNCGNWCGIGLHSVHEDGTITASFYHSQGTNYAIGESPEGCGWHEFLKLADYSGGPFGPDKKEQ